ncbi:hypothetical protein [Sinorhizobium fredii]|uniref:hypothetical protein n=1 Tax=Rhizobium fredii TaxID=380 RepID=UPI0035172517
MNALNSAPCDAAFQHPLAGIVPEVNFNKRIRHLTKRRRLDGERQGGHEPAKGIQILTAKAARPVRRPTAVEIVHLPDRVRSTQREYLGEIAGVACLLEFREDWELVRHVAAQGQMELGKAILEHVVERAAAPLPIIVFGIVAKEFPLPGVEALARFPIESLRFSDRMKSIQENRRLDELDAERAHALAEARDQVALARAAKALVEKPVENSLGPFAGHRLHFPNRPLMP